MAIVLFGATGYTGRKTAAAMVARGLRPTLAGRNQAKLDALAASLGGLPVAVADVAAPATVRALVDAGDVLVTTVGPFARFGQAALAAALDAGAHYVDSTGEPSFVRHVQVSADEPARARGCTVLTAFGYDYVPGHTAAGAALAAAGPAAVAVDVGYFVAGGGAFRRSQGTNASLVGALVDPGLFWRGGRLVEDFGGTRWRRFALNGRPLPAISVPASEHLWLPPLYPQLREVGVYLGWFGKASPWLSRLSRLNAPLLKRRRLRAALKAVLPQPTSQGGGPSDDELAVSGSQIVAEARDAQGAVLARAELRGTDGYNYTAGMLAWGAAALAEGQARTAGATGPLQAFGLAPLIAANAAAGLELAVTDGAGRPCEVPA